MAGKGKGLFKRPCAVAVEPEAVAPEIGFYEIDGGGERERAEFEFQSGAVGVGLIQGTERNGERRKREGNAGRGDAKLNGREFGLCSLEVGKESEDLCKRFTECFSAKAGEGSDFAKAVVILEDEPFSFSQRVVIKVRYHNEMQNRSV